MSTAKLGERRWRLFSTFPGPEVWGKVPRSQAPLLFLNKRCQHQTVVLFRLFRCEDMKHEDYGEV
ncbi:MAG: hypothetical protein JSU60_03040, partial [Nitrospirota bacterium]